MDIYSNKNIIIDRNMLMYIERARALQLVRFKERYPFHVNIRRSVKQTDSIVVFECYSEKKRDKAFMLLENFSFAIGLSRPLCYRAEDITPKMIKELDENNGNFKCWDKYFTMTTVKNFLTLTKIDKVKPDQLKNACSFTEAVNYLTGRH